MADHTCCSRDHLAVEVRDVYVSFDGQPVLRGVNMHVHSGHVVALIGPNGCGKTTLLRCLLGLQRPDKGELRILGQRDPVRALPRIGYVPQKLNLERNFSLSVREFLALRLRQTQQWFWMRRARLDALLHESLAKIGVETLFDRPLSGLSGGQLQRVMIAFSLLHQPQLLLLDEPTAGVDAPGEQTFYELISEIHARNKLTVILVSHDLSMVYRHASWVYALNGVICCEGSPEQVMNAESLKQAYGLQVSPYHHHGHGHVH